MCASVCVLLMSVSQSVSTAAGKMTELSHQAQRSAVNQTLGLKSQGHSRERVRVKGQSGCIAMPTYFLKGLNEKRIEEKLSNCVVSA